MNPELVHLCHTANAKFRLDHVECAVDRLWMVDEKARDVDGRNEGDDDDYAQKAAKGTAHDFVLQRVLDNDVSACCHSDYHPSAEDDEEVVQRIPEVAVEEDVPG